MTEEMLVWVETYEKKLIKTGLGDLIYAQAGQLLLCRDPLPEPLVLYTTDPVEEEAGDRLADRAYKAFQDAIGRNNPIVSFYVDTGRRS